MDRATYLAIEREMIAALEPIAEKYGMKVVGGGGTFTPVNYKPKIEFVTKDESGALNTAEFRMLKLRYPEMAGKTFYVAGKGYVQPIGYRPKAPKYPFLARYPDGKVYGIPMSSALAWFTPEREAAA